MLALLRHLERAGFTGAPRVIEPGLDPEGREMLSYIEGESPHPRAWSEEAAYEVGALLRHLHRATASFVAPPDAVWMPWWGRDLPAAEVVIGHGDASPWNFLAREGRPVALLDWDTAGPVGAIWDLSQAAWLNAQLHDEALAAGLGLPTLDVRARQVRAILEGYELPARERASVLDRMIEIAVRSAAQEALDAGVTADGVSPASMGRLSGGAPTFGHDLLWAISWRTRSAAYMLRNRDALDALIRRR